MSKGDRETIAKAMVRENLECTRENFAELAESLWQHSKEHNDLGAVILPDEAFIESALGPVAGPLETLEEA